MFNRGGGSSANSSNQLSFLSLGIDVQGQAPKKPDPEAQGKASKRPDPDGVRAKDLIKEEAVSSSSSSKIAKDNVLWTRSRLGLSEDKNTSVAFLSQSDNPITQRINPETGKTEYVVKKLLNFADDTVFNEAKPRAKIANSPLNGQEVIRGGMTAEQAIARMNQRLGK